MTNAEFRPLLRMLARTHRCTREEVSHPGDAKKLSREDVGIGVKASRAGEMQFELVFADGKRERARASSERLAANSATNRAFSSTSTWQTMHTQDQIILCAVSPKATRRECSAISTCVGVLDSSPSSSCEKERGREKDFGMAKSA